MSALARHPMLLVIGCALFAGCTPRALGADEDAGPPIDPPSTHAAQKDGCPQSEPIDGTRCFSAGPERCDFWNVSRGCTMTYVCGIEEVWHRLEASCALMTPDVCVPGAPCEPQSRCTTPKVADCVCNAVGRLECQPAAPQIR